MTDSLPDKPQQLRTTVVFTFLVPLYIAFYTLLAFWLLIDGWISNFSSIYWVWSMTNNTTFPMMVNHLLFTILGSMLGCAVLGIISFHKYKAINKNFDPDHLCGFFLAPLLALIVGILIFAMLQSGLVVLTSGTISESQSSISASLGYLAIGGISGYNWDVFVKKLQELSKNVLNAKESHTNNDPPKNNASSEMN